MHASHFRLSRISGFCAVILALLALVLVVLVQAYSVERSRLRGAEKDVTYGKPEETKHFWKYEMPGLQGPRAVSAEASKLADGEEVIGVVIDGKPRAYWLKALRHPPWHIVNDVIEGVPVSVTFCDRADCTRVYTGARSSKPLDLNLGGLYGREMVVEAGGVLYLQETGKPFEAGAGVPPIPYANLPWERTTWKAWRQRHPETDIFIGLGGIGPKP